MESLEGKTPPTFGEKLVEPKTLGEGQVSKSDELKFLAAKMIDILEEWRNGVVAERPMSRDEAFVITMAQQAVLAASMASVKAVAYVAA